MRTRHLLAGPLALVLAACAAGATPESVEPTTRPTPQPATAEATPAPSAASATPAPSTAALDVQVSFDGETCEYAGPTVIVDGTVVRFEYTPDESAASSYLLVYAVEPGVTYQMLLDHQAKYGGADVSVNIPEWVLQNTASNIHGGGTLIYKIESIKPGMGDPNRPVGGYQVLCTTPAVHPAVQLTVAGN